MSEIQKLLDADAANAKECALLFHKFSPELSQALEDGVHFYEILFRVLNKKFRDDDDQYTIDGEDKIKNYNKWESAKNRIWSRRARATLFLSGYRSYMWAVTDIYRTRVTSSMNNLRQQIEAVFYMNLILKNPSVGEEWFYAGAEKGKEFYRKYRQELGKFLHEYKLGSTYNRISGAASHTRLSSLIYGLEIDSKKMKDRYTDIYTLSLHEVNQHKPEQFILNVLAFLKDQINIFDALLSALPEFDDPLLRETRLSFFENKILQLFALFQKKFPAKANEILLCKNVS